jgi:O-antigen/teichoic acid export membrane protein
LYAYPIISKGDIKIFMFVETFFSITFICLTYLLVDLYGVSGANFAYMINYIVCLIFVKKYSGKKIL